MVESENLFERCGCGKLESKKLPLAREIRTWAILECAA